MISTIYVEDEIADHPRTLTILNRFPEALVIPCKRYGEIFNRKAQNFRLQKQKPALILAKKQQGRLLPTPKQYGIGADINYYFSHMLNCLYDCRYCFLQGMFQSAHYVLFVNYEDFLTDFKTLLQQHNGKPIHFFSGYDCDSLALDPVTDFVAQFLPFFQDHANALLELRTKSTQIRTLLDHTPTKNCVVAFSFTPEKIANALEHKTPPINKRLQAILDLQAAGWHIGLRFDPLIYTQDYAHEYETLFTQVFSKLNPDLIHSVSLGSFRLPKDYYHKLEKLYPAEKLFSSPLIEQNGEMSYLPAIRHELVQFCRQQILQSIPTTKFFCCENTL